MNKGRVPLSQLARILLCVTFVMQTCALPVRAKSTVALCINISNRLAPEPVTDLASVPGALEGTIGLTWTAPHEIGVDDGKVEGYIVKYATFSVASLSGNTTAWWYHPRTLTGLEISAAQVHDPGTRENNEIMALDSGTTYYMAVRSFTSLSRWSDFDTNAYGTQTSAVSADIAPSTPTGLACGTLSSTSATLAWDTMSSQPGYVDFDHFEIYRSTDIATPVLLATTSLPTYTDSPLTPGTTYYYWLRAVDAAPLVLYSSMTAPVTVCPPLIVVVDNVRPRAPAGVRLAMVNGDPQITWSMATNNEDGTPFTDKDSYRIYRSAGLVGGWNEAARVQGATSDACVFVDTTVRAAVAVGTVYYKLRAADIHGNESADSMVCDTGKNLIALDSNVAATATIPKSISDPLYKGAEFDDDIVVKVVQAQENIEGQNTVVYEFTAEKASSGEQVIALRFARPIVKISLKLDALQAGARRKALSTGQDICLFWFNGVEWTKISSELEDNVISALTSRLGKYMARASLRAQNFTMNKVYPRIFTPNGDGLNDIVEFQFENPMDSSVSGRIFDLHSALVGEMKKGGNVSALNWDGKTLNNITAPQGVYIYQIEVTGAESKTFNGIIILAK